MHLQPAFEKKLVKKSPEMTTDVFCSRAGVSFASGTGSRDRCPTSFCGLSESNFSWLRSSFDPASNPTKIQVKTPAIQLNPSKSRLIFFEQNARSDITTALKHLSTA